MPKYDTLVVREEGGALLTDTVSQPRKRPQPQPEAQGMVMPPQGLTPAGPPQEGAPQGADPNALAQEPLSPGGGQLGQVDPDLARWSLGNDPWAVMNLIAGDARTRSEVQDRLNNFLRMPTGQSMPQHIRTAIRAMGFQVLDPNNAADGRAEVDPLGTGMTPGPEQEPVRETMGAIQNAGLPAARPPEEGQWVSMTHAGVPLIVYISPGGTVLKGPAAMIGANIKHMNPLSGERHMTFHPTGHIPPLADAQATYAEHPNGAMPIRLRRQDSQLALVQALHDVASQAQSAKDGQAQSQNEAIAAQMQRQGAAASPQPNEAAGHTGFSSSPLPLSSAGDRGADNPMAGAKTHASPEHDADTIAASGTGGQGGDSSPYLHEKPPSTDLVPGGGAQTAGMGAEGSEEEEQSPEDQDVVPPTHKMQAWLLDHVMAHQPQMEQMGGYSQPNEVARSLEESGSPPEQVLALAHSMHMWHPSGGPPEEKSAQLAQIIGQALERAQRAGAIQPYDRTHYQHAVDQLQDFVQHHGRFPSQREMATHMYARGPEGGSGDVTGQGASYGERPRAPGY